MALFVTEADFTGEYKVPKDKYSSIDFQAYIDKYEKNLLIQLLGASMYKAFILDYTSSNPTPNTFTEDRYKAIYNEILIDEDDCRLIHSEGIKLMLVQLIYFYYVRDLNFKLTIGGAANNSQADATVAPFESTNIIDVYNMGVTSWNWIQYYIDCYNPENYDYNNFNGRIKNLNSIL